MMPQWVICLLDKHKDPSSDAHHLLDILSMVECACLESSTGGVEKHENYRLSFSEKLSQNLK